MKSVLILVFLIVASFAVHGQSKSGEAVLFGSGVISTPYHEWTTTFTPDGNTVYFSRGRSPEAIIYSKKLNGKWQTPQIADFSGTWYDTDPFITRDGKHLYFCSNRPADQNPTTKTDKTFHIWVVARIDEDKWSVPALLDTIINHPGVNSWYPSETENGDFYFHSYGRPGGHGKNDIYLSKHTGDNFTAPTLISIDTAGFNTQECAISKRNDFMLFISNKPGGIGLSDIYITFNKDGVWSKPINMGPQVNHPYTTAMSPALSPDETTLYFATNYIPIPDIPAHMANYQEMLKKMNSVYNGFANIYSVPLNIAALRSKAVW
jgi:Tol biopolymer transport system component